jgi:hypothetical protein
MKSPPDTNMVLRIDREDSHSKDRSASLVLPTRTFQLPFGGQCALTMKLMGGDDEHEDNLGSDGKP